MSRKFKNILMIILLVLLVVANFFTVKYAKNSSMPGMKDTSNMSGMGTPPDMSSSDSNTSEPPEKPSNDSNTSEPPEKPSNDSNTSEPPEKPSNDSSSNQNGDMEEPPSNSGDMQPMNSTGSNSNIVYYILFATEGLGIALIIIYLIMSNFNKKSFNEVLKVNKKLTIYILSSLLIAGSITALDTFLSVNSSKSVVNESNASSNATGNTEVTTEETLSGSYTSTTSDESAILVKDGGNLTLTDSEVTKTGDSSNTEN